MSCPSLSARRRHCVWIFQGVDSTSRYLYSEMYLMRPFLQCQYDTAIFILSACLFCNPQKQTVSLQSDPEIEQTVHVTKVRYFVGSRSYTDWAHGLPSRVRCDDWNMVRAYFTLIDTLHFLNHPTKMVVSSSLIISTRMLCQTSCHTGIALVRAIFFFYFLQ